MPQRAAQAAHEDVSGLAGAAAGAGAGRAAGPGRARLGLDALRRLGGQQPSACGGEPAGFPVPGHGAAAAQQLPGAATGAAAARDRAGDAAGSGRGPGPGAGSPAGCAAAGPAAEPGPREGGRGFVYRPVFAIVHWVSGQPWEVSGGGGG